MNPNGKVPDIPSWSARDYGNRIGNWRLFEILDELKLPATILLNSAVWDADLVRDDLRAYILERLGDPQAVLVIDETSFRKRGKKSAGVARQHCGTTGHLENCQVGVFLAYASRHGHTLIDRRVYLPESWTSNPQRCAQAGVPHDIGFATRSQLAHDMITAAITAQVPARWVAADEAYGGREQRQQAG